MTSPNTLIGLGMKFPLNLNPKGTLVLDTGLPLLKSSINNLLAFLIGDRYFLGEFGASVEDLLEEPNDDVTLAVLEHRIQTQLPYWDPRIILNHCQIERDNFMDVKVILSIGLKGTDLSELIIIPITVNTVQ